MCGLLFQAEYFIMSMCFRIIRQRVKKERQKYLHGKSAHLLEAAGLDLKRWKEWQRKGVERERQSARNKGSPSQWQSSLVPSASISSNSQPCCDREMPGPIPVM
jgi:hypothetical protein